MIPHKMLQQPITKLKNKTFLTNKKLCNSLSVPTQTKWPSYGLRCPTALNDVKLWCWTVRCDTDSIEVVERGSELIHLFLANAFGVTGQNLVLDLIDGASDGGEELLPTHTDVLEEEKRLQEHNALGVWLWAFESLHVSIPPWCS